ncbi:MAG: hypothetical protein NZ898_09500 [Myxococcota bacterium]|nr:hypothetical protein [Myxococcota bacterium]
MDRCPTCHAWVDPAATHCDGCQSPLRTGGRDLDDDWLAPRGTEAHLELDVAALYRGRPPPRLVAPAPAPANAPPTAAIRSTPARVSMAPDTPAARRADPQESIARVEAETYARFGPAPSGWLASIPYAIRVWLRRQQMREELQEAMRLRADVARVSDDALEALGRALVERCKDALASSPLAPQLCAALEALEALGREEQALAAERRDATERENELERGASALRDELGALRDREVRLATQHATRESEWQRAQARLQRAQIALREAERAGLRTTDPARISLLEADVTVREQEAGTVRAALDEVAAQLTEARHELARHTELVAAHEARRRALEQETSRRRAALELGLQEGRRRLATALRMLGEAALTTGTPSDAAAQAQRALTALGRLEERRRIEALRRAALDAYDARAYRRGLGLLLAAAVVVLAALVAIVVG